MKIKLWILLIMIVVFCGIGVYTDIASNNKITKISALPEESISGNATKVLWSLENGETPDFNGIYLECDYIDGRYDKSDFSFQTLLRLMYGYDDEIPEDAKGRIKESFIGFKYWMDQPGEDGMCYWSENHQILFATSEYLAGQLYPEAIFFNDNKTGLEHKEMGRERVLIWLEQRWLYGFTEWYSSVYYKEDLLALSNLIEFAEDEEVVIKATMIMDLLLYDMVTQSYKGTFVTTSGRYYEANKLSGHGNRLNRVAESLFGFDLEAEDKESGLDLNFLYMDNYEVPQVLEEIAFDTDEVIIKASNGLDVTELEGEDLLGQEDSEIMMQWAMEAFTNPEVIENSLAYIEAHNMFSNEFLYDFSLMNVGILKVTGLLPVISQVLNFKTNGVAIQRANTYTYKNNDYMLATAMNYHPGEFADQQHIWTANLSNDVSVFTTHPALPLTDDGALSGSPNYWVGSGRLPHSVQDENINLSLYVIPNRTGFMEESLVDYTHAYFAKDLMDEVIIEDEYIYGRLEDTYIAMIGYNALNYGEDSTVDLIQQGKTTYWITELSSGQTESFDEFIGRIQSNPIEFDEKNFKLSYTSSGKILTLTYQEEFMVDNTVVDTEYSRFDSPYVDVERKDETMTITCNGEELYLDFYNLERRIINTEE